MDIRKLLWNLIKGMLKLAWKLFLIALWGMLRIAQTILEQLAKLLETNIK